MQNTEKGTLLEALVQFPSFYTFSVVGKVETTSRKPGHDFTKDSLETVERMCGTRLAEDSYSVKVSYRRIPLYFQFSQVDRFVENLLTVGVICMQILASWKLGLTVD